jgi:tetratricopeptide (TPR) repeat protein
LAARMHLALGAVYLDRVRYADALREFTSAARLDASRADALTFEGLVHQRLRQAPEAVSALRRAYAIDPSAVLAYTLGRELMRAGTADEAERVLRAFREKAPPSGKTADAPFLSVELIPEQPGIEPFLPPVLYSDGFARLQNGDFAGAIVAFREALGRDPMTTTGLESGAIAQAAAAFRQGDLAAAQQRVSTAIELAPDRAEPHRVMGLVLMAGRRYDMAVDEMRAAIQLNAYDERAHLGLADALVASGRLDDAARELEQTLQALPTSGRARYARGLVFQRQGRYPDARQDFAKAVAMNPLLGANSIYQSIGTLSRSQQDYDAAIEAFSARVDRVPNDPRAHRDLGDMYFRQGRDEQALAEFTASLVLDRTNPDTFTAIGQVHLREGRFQDAATAARDAIRLDDAHKEAHYLLATSLLRLGLDTDGKRELEVYQRLQSEATARRTRQLEVEGLRRDAAVSAAAKDYEKAAALLTTALEREPDSAATRVDLGITLLHASRPAEAVEQFTAALRSLGDDPDVHAYLAQAYEALGRRDDSAREQATADRLMRESLRRAGAQR